MNPRDWSPNTWGIIVFAIALLLMTNWNG